MSIKSQLRVKESPHPFGALLTQHRNRKPGLTQTHLAELAGYDQAILVRMCQGKKDLTGPSGRERVIRLLEVLRDASALTTLDEANGLLAAANLPPLYEGLPTEVLLMRVLQPPARPVEESTVAVRHNLPVPITQLIGRDEDVAALKQLLEKVRLVTLTGAGGSGKTCMALNVAYQISNRFTHGVCLVSLAGVQQAELVPTAIAQALAVRERPDQSMLESLKRYVHQKHLLLVLDNFEHLLDTTPLVTELMASAPHLKVLATSRESLRLSGEHVLAVEPLTLPAATTLFIHRARAVKHRFEVKDGQRDVIQHICRRVDCLPLAIELAAARIRHATPEFLLEQLSHLDGPNTLDILSEGPRDMPARQHTLRNTIAWSFQLLSPEEQRLLRALGIFVDGAELEQLDQVYTALGTPQSGRRIDTLHLLQSLIDKNLVRLEALPSGTPRYRQLELIREFALDTFKHDPQGLTDLATLQHAHAAAFAQLAGNSVRVIYGKEQTIRLERVQRDYGNLQAAMKWSFNGGSALLGCRLVAGLTGFWSQQTRLGQFAGAWVELAIHAVTDQMPIPVQAGVYLAAAVFLQNGMASVESRRKVLQLYESADDTEGIALGKCLVGQALVWECHQAEEGVQMLQESLALARAIGEDGAWLTRLNLSCLGQIAAVGDDLEQAEMFHWESLRQYRLADDLNGTGDELLELSALVSEGAHVDRSQFDVALSLAEEALTVSRLLDDVYMESRARRQLIELWHLSGDIDKAISYAMKTLEFVREHTNEFEMVYVMLILARAVQDTGGLRWAVSLLSDALQILISLSHTSRDPAIAVLAELACVAGQQGQPRRSTHLFGIADSLRDVIHSKPVRHTQRIYAGHIAKARAALGDAAYDAAYAEGRDMPLEQAIAYSLASPSA